MKEGEQVIETVLLQDRQRDRILTYFMLLVLIARVLIVTTVRIA